MGTHHHKTFERAVADVIQSILEAKAAATASGNSGFFIECLDVAESTVRLITYYNAEVLRAKGREA